MLEFMDIFHESVHEPQQFIQILQVFKNKK